MFKILVTAYDLDKFDRGFWPVLNTSAENATIVGWAKSESSAKLVLANRFGPDDARELGNDQPRREFWPVSARAARLLGQRKFVVGRVWEPAADTTARTDADPAADNPA